MTNMTPDRWLGDDPLNYEPPDAVRPIITNEMLVRLMYAVGFPPARRDDTPETR